MVSTSTVNILRDVIIEVNANYHARYIGKSGRWKQFSISTEMGILEHDNIL